MDQSIFPSRIPLDRSFGMGVAATTSLDTTEAIRVQYIGTTYGYATLTLVASTSLTAYHGTASADTLDSTFGTTGAIDLSASTGDTLGELVDLINKSPNWRAKLTGGLRDDLSANLAARTVTSAVLDAGLSLYFDGTDGILSHAITGIEFKNRSSAPGYDDGMYDDKGCVNTLAYAINSVTDLTGTSKFQVLAAKDTDTTSTARVLFEEAAADSTANTVGNAAASLGAALYMSHEGERLICRLTCGTSLTSMAQFVVRGACYDFRRGRVT
jgi:hypothetical protein